jgi:hypothetical protein
VGRRASWTGPEQVTMTGAAVTTYALGGPTSTWGRTWAVADFEPPKFRVPITDVTDHPNKEFRLDGVTVQVDYTP